MKTLKLTSLLLVSFTFINFVHAQKNPEAYIMYNSQGKKVNWTKMIDNVSEVDIVFFGEQHNDPIAHWLQLNLVNDLLKIDSSNLVLGVEMFETDNQLIIDEYLAGFVDAKRFEEGARLWNNYKTDYKPLLRAAKENNLTFIACNIPRRYANMVSKGGFESLESLSEESLSLIAPLPIAYDTLVPAYKKMLEMDMGPVRMNKENFPKAQSTKDATMAYNILKNWEKGLLFLHFNGAFHSDFHDGIIWHLKKSNADLKIMTLSTVLQDDTSFLEEENLNRADYIIVIPSTMTRTY